MLRTESQHFLLPTASGVRRRRPRRHGAESRQSMHSKRRLLTSRSGQGRHGCRLVEIGQRFGRVETNLGVVLRNALFENLNRPFVALPLPTEVRPWRRSPGRATGFSTIAVAVAAARAIRPRQYYGPRAYSDRHCLCSEDGALAQRIRQFWRGDSFLTAFDEAVESIVNGFANLLTDANRLPLVIEHESHVAALGCDTTSQTRPLVAWAASSASARGIDQYRAFGNRHQMAGANLIAEQCCLTQASFQ